MPRRRERTRPAGHLHRNPYYCFTGATALLAAGFAVFLTDFLACFLVVFAVAAAAGLEAAAPLAAGAGDCAPAKVRGMVASASAKVRIVVFISFSPSRA